MTVATINPSDREDNNELPAPIAPPDRFEEVTMRRKHVGILIFPSVEVLDFCGPFEVFSVTRLDEERRREEPSPFEVLVVSEERGVTVTAGGLKVIPNCTPDDCPPLVVLCVPRR